MTAQTFLNNPLFLAGPASATSLRATLLAGTAIMSLGLVGPAIGQTNWTGGTNSVWNNPPNWDAGVPDSEMNTIIDTDEPGGAGAVLSVPGAETGVLTVGNVATGLLTLDGGGRLATNGVAYIGRTTGSDGTVVVTGTGTQWDITGPLYLTTQLSSSAGAEGTLTIDDGGRVNVTGFAWVGGRSVGTLNLSNLGVFNVGQSLFVGDQDGALGTVLIDSGGTIDVDGSMTIGGLVGAQGFVTVTGMGSAITANDLTVGGTGDGTLTIMGAGRVTTDGDSRIGGAGPTNGIALVTGTDSHWDIGGDFIVGDAGTGQAIFAANATGEVQGEVFVGLYGGSQGTLNIQSGSRLDSGVASIGWEAGAVGTVNINGAGTVWDVQGAGNPHLVIGDGGTGTLNIADGGIADVGGVTIIGNQDGSEGYLNVLASGAGTSLYYSSNDVIFGAQAGSFGQGTISGANAELDASANFYLGDAGYGVLTVSNGAELDVSSTAYVGHQAGSTGELVIDGGEVDVFGGSPSSEIYVGYQGNGIVTISNAGLLRARMLHVGAQDGSDGTILIQSGGEAEIDLNVNIGSESGSMGRVTITGNGSRIWGYNYDLYVGEHGSGTLDITDEGLVTDVDSLVIGTFGSVALDGDGSRLEVNNRIDVGRGDTGVGRLRVTNGGAATAAEVLIGRSSDDKGEIGIEGTGSSMTISGDLVLGADETAGGMLSILDGGVVDVGGEILVGGDVGIGSPTGTVLIAGGGKLSSTHTSLPGRHMTIGSFEGSTGDVTVTGNNSELSLGSNAIRVGHEGAGSLEVSDGGAVTSHNGYIGYGSTGVGDVLVTGNGSQWDMTNPLSVGYSGTGNLTVANGGRVSSTAGDIGYNTGSDGAVLVTGAGAELSLTENLSVGREGNGTLTVAEGGTVWADGIVLANSSGTDGTLNIGAAAGDTAAGAGTLAGVPGLFFGQGTATLVFNHTASEGDNYEFTADLGSSGAGTHRIDHEAGVTSYTGDGSGFSGTTTVAGGTLYVNNALGGAIAVDGGILSGTGNLGALTVNGGVLAPGNSIGTLNVASAVFNPGSTYEVELNDGGFVAGANNDLLNATGAVTINGGTILVTPVNGTDDGSSYMPGTYTIITAGGGVSGTFDAITDDFAFLSFADTYDANNVYLISSLVSPGFCLSGFSANQCASGSGVSSLGAGSALYDAVLVLATGDAPGALDQLSGEAHASAKTALITNSARLRGIINNRINAAFGGEPSSQSFPIMGYGPSGGLVDLPPSHRYGAWAHAYGAWGSSSATANTAAMRQDDRGFLMGADGHLGGTWHGGVFTGYGRSSFRADSRTSSGSSDNFHLGAYAGGELGAFNLNLGAAHTWHSIGTTRSVAFPGFTDTLTASYSARTMQLFGEASYRIDAGGARFEPFVGLAHVNLHTNGFSEAGGAAALTSAASSTSTTFSTIGVRASTGFHMGDMKATARTMIGWRHAFGNMAPTSSFAFAGGSSFVVSGAPIARNTAVLELGLDMEIGKNATLGLSYDGQFGSGTTSHSANARLAISF